jgi:hypothetical protein
MEIRRLIEKIIKNSRQVLFASLLMLSGQFVIQALHKSNFVYGQNQIPLKEPFLDVDQNNKLIDSFLEDEKGLQSINTSGIQDYPFLEVIDDNEEFYEKSLEYYDEYGDPQSNVAGAKLFEAIIGKTDFLTNPVSVTTNIAIYDIAVNGDGTDCVAGRQIGDEFPFDLEVEGSILNGESFLAEEKPNTDHGKKVLHTILAGMPRGIGIDPVLSLDAYFNQPEFPRDTAYGNLPECLREKYPKEIFDKLVEFTPITQTLKLPYGGTYFMEAMNMFSSHKLDAISISLAYDEVVESKWADSNEFVEIMNAFINKNPNFILSFSAGNNGDDPAPDNDSIIRQMHWYKLAQRFPKNVLVSAANNLEGNPTEFTPFHVYTRGVSGLGDDVFSAIRFLDINNNKIDDLYENAGIVDDNLEDEREDQKLRAYSFSGTSSSQPGNLRIGIVVNELLNLVNSGIISDTNKVNLTPVEILKASAVLPEEYRTGSDFDPETGTHNRLGYGIVDLFNAQLLVLDKANMFGRDETSLTETQIKNRSDFENYFIDIFNIRPDKELEWSKIFELLDNKLVVTDYLTGLGQYQVMLPLITK